MLLKTTSSLILALFLLGSGIVATNNGSVEAQIVSQNSRRANRQEILEKLNLTPQQKQKIASIRQKHRSEIEGLRQQIRTNQEELQTLMAGNSTDKELMAKHQKISELRQELANLNFENMLEIRQVLTPSQRSQMAQVMKERRSQRPMPEVGPPPDDL
jgi:Spy/CpxP family protein refolding chaperone